MKCKIAASLLAPAVLLAFSPASKTSKAAAHGTSHSSTSKAHPTKRRTSKARKRSGPSYQTHPTSERYKEIQQALADKGYFKGEVNGEWGDDSVDALKRFQSEHQLPEDGKISALSLIQLGLGPKHDGGAVSLAPAPSTDPPPVPSVSEAPQDSHITQ
jgi:peptidoglycan hydrolase-like protein with peptidoglycan-binding domain